MNNSEPLIEMKITFDNMPASLNESSPEYRKIIDFHKEHFGEEAIQNLEISKICDFCEKVLPFNFETSVCGICDKTYDVCKDCKTNSKNSTICFKKEC